MISPREENLEQEGTAQVNQFIEVVLVPEEHGVHGTHRLGRDRGPLGLPKGVCSGRVGLAGRIEGRVCGQAPAAPLGDRGRHADLGDVQGARAHCACLRCVSLWMDSE